MLVDFVHKDGVSPASVCEYDEIRSYVHFLRQGGGFVRGWPNFLENYRSFYPDSIDVNAFGRAALPHFPGRQPVSVFGGWNLMLSKYSANKGAAMEFIRYFQGVEAQKIMFDIGGFIPTNQKVYEDSSYLERHPELVYYRRLLDHGFHRPQLIEYTRMSDIISYYAHLAIKGELPVREALERAAHDMQTEHVFHN
jgi:ABC-type glycerol-3-phosphate transport system substrate-binding protein